jgi:hypothetical protein
MSILDLTTDLFRDPVNLRSFVDDPDHALDHGCVDLDISGVAWGQAVE